MDNAEHITSRAKRRATPRTIAHALREVIAQLRRRDQRRRQRKGGDK